MGAFDGLISYPAYKPPVRRPEDLYVPGQPSFRLYPKYSLADLEKAVTKAISDGDELIEIPEENHSDRWVRISTWYAEELVRRVKNDQYDKFNASI
jgi:hypothetical protein